MRDSCARRAAGFGPAAPGGGGPTRWGLHKEVFTEIFRAAATYVWGNVTVKTPSLYRALT